MSRATEINFENWTFVHYTIDGLKSFISIGANPKSEEIQYFVTVTDKENQEVFQVNHGEIEAAIEDINKRYRHWEIFDAEHPPKEDGCSSCSAH